MDIDRRKALSALPALGALALPAAAASSRWRSHFADGLTDWGPLQRAWGWHNHRFLTEPGVQGRLLRVALPQGSIDPGSMRRRGLPTAGTGFKAAVLAGGTSAARLRYRLRFAPGFDFVRGGKLPGLYGGNGPSGGRIPDGTDGCSFRLMWREQGQGEVYAYLPDSRLHGSSLLRGHFAFSPGQWHQLEQEVVLNTPGQRDGRVRIWLDGRLAGVAAALTMRHHPSLQLDGVFVDVFFGGNDDSWAARADTHIDLAEFEVEAGSGKA